MNVKGLAPPLIVAVKVTDWPVVGVAGLDVKLTLGATLTPIGREANEVTPRVSVAVRLTVNEPVVAYVWIVLHLLADQPSPKIQLQTRLPTPPVDTRAKLTGTPASAGFGLAEAVTASLELTTRVWVAVAV